MAKIQKESFPFFIFAKIKKEKEQRLSRNKLIIAPMSTKSLYLRLFIIRITAKNINKGVAIREIQELLGINYEETVVFGDYLNDLEMMESGYYSYAMKNAHDDLKKVARFIAKSNDENGVVEAIKELIR